MITPDGRHHTFAQFGSGTLHGTPTYLSRFMMVEPLALIAEAEHLAALGVARPLSLLAVDREALLTTPYHRALNRAAGFYGRYSGPLAVTLTVLASFTFLTNVSSVLGTQLGLQAVTSTEDYRFAAQRMSVQSCR